MTLLSATSPLNNSKSVAIFGRPERNQYRCITWPIFSPKSPVRSGCYRATPTTNSSCACIVSFSVTGREGPCFTRSPPGYANVRGQAAPGSCGDGRVGGAGSLPQHTVEYAAAHQGCVPPSARGGFSLARSEAVVPEHGERMARSPPPL